MVRDVRKEMAAANIFKLHNDVFMQHPKQDKVICAVQKNEIASLRIFQGLELKMDCKLMEATLGRGVKPLCLSLLEAVHYGTLLHH